MKLGFFITALISVFAAHGQSPYLSVLLKMDSLVSDHLQYKIEMKICELKKPSEFSDWFTHDTSKVDFRSLKPDELKCGDFFSSNEGWVELTGGAKSKNENDRFEFGNQVMAFETMLMFKITDVSHRNWIKPMYIVMPIKIKSFTTYVELNNVVFLEDKVVFLDAQECKLEGSKLFIKQSLRNATGIFVKDFPLMSQLRLN